MNNQELSSHNTLTFSFSTLPQARKTVAQLLDDKEALDQWFANIEKSGRWNQKNHRKLLRGASQTPCKAVATAFLSNQSCHASLCRSSRRLPDSSWLAKMATACSTDG